MSDPHLPPPQPSPLTLIGRSAFWRPRHTAKAERLRQIPFLFWLIDALRPRQVVQIGLPEPATYLSLCQALDKTSRDSLALGIALPPGPDLPRSIGLARAPSLAAPPGAEQADDKGVAPPSAAARPPAAKDAGASGADDAGDDTAHDTASADPSSAVQTAVQPALQPADKTQHDLLYGDFSSLVTAPLETAAAQLYGRSIDLLVLDQTLTPALMDDLRRHILPRLSAQSALILLGQTLGTSVAAPDLDNGQEAAGDAAQIAQFLAELRRDRQALSLIDLGENLALGSAPAAGLELLLSPQDLPQGLGALSALAPGSAEFLAVQQVFARLGEGLEAAQLAQSRQAALVHSQTQASELAAKLAQIEAELAAERAERQAAQAGEAQQVSVAAGLQAQLFDQQSLIRKLEHELAAAQSQLEHAKDQAQALSAAKAELTKAKETEAQSAAELTNVRAKLANAETALRGQAAALETSERLEQDLAALRAQAKEAQDRRLLAWEEHEQLRAAYDRLAAG